MIRVERSKNVSASVVFICGLAITLLVSLAVVVYLKSPLQRILIQLCGNAERAAFWSAFSSVAISIVPALFAIQAHPDAGSPAPAIFELADQLKWGLAGLVLTLTITAWVIGRFIARTPIINSSKRENSLAA
jgi:hypothetical protein